MYLRVKRDTFDTVPDSIVSAASSIGAPILQESSGLLLKVISVSGGQLTNLYDKLSQFMSEDSALAKSENARKLLEETGRCSHLFIVSTSIELILVSDRSRDEHGKVKREFQELMP